MLDPKELDKDQYLIYAWCREDSDDEVKIGKSTAGKLYGRIITAQTDNPYNIVFIGVQLVDAEDIYEMRKYEEGILDRFYRIRESAEWIINDEDARAWIKENITPIGLDEFKHFHRDKTREYRRKPMFVEKERKATRSRRAKERLARDKDVNPITSPKENSKKQSKIGFFK